MRKIEIRVEAGAKAFQEAVRSFQDLHQEFLQVRKENRLRDSRRSSQRDFINLMNIRGYIQFAKTCYQAEPLPELQRKFIVIDIEETNVYENAQSSQSLLTVPYTAVKAVVDSGDGFFKIIYTGSNAQLAFAFKPYTSDDFNKYAMIFRNLSRMQDFEYSPERSLPVRPLDDFVIPINKRQRKTVLWRDSESMKEEEEIEYSEELEDNQSEGSSLEYVEDSANQSIKSKSFDSLSSYSDVEEEVYIPDSGLRSWTTLAALGRSEGLVNLLTKGGIFMKYGRWGKPHLRHVVVTGDLKYIEWRPLGKMKSSGNMPTASISQVVLGRTTKVFKRFHKERDENSFSILFSTRTLDLELTKENTVPREVWVEALKMLLDQGFKRDEVKRWIFKRSSYLN